MNEFTFASVGALLLRLLTIAVFALLYLLPLILRRWRGETTHDRRAAARNANGPDQPRTPAAELEIDADTAIAVKRAEVRREAEILWAEHQLTQARIAIEAQVEIDREQQRRRVAEALEAPVHAVGAYLRGRGGRHLLADRRRGGSRQPGRRRIACSARALTGVAPENLPARVEPAGDVEPHTERESPSIPSFPDATRAAARWIRPLVPPFVARVIDNTTQPLLGPAHRTSGIRGRRGDRVLLQTHPQGHGRHRNPTSNRRRPHPRPPRDGGHQPYRIVARPSLPGQTRDQRYEPRASLAGAPANDLAGLSVAGRSRDQRELAERDGPQELRSPDGPRELPPAE